MRIQLVSILFCLLLCLAIFMPHQNLEEIPVDEPISIEDYVGTYRHLASVLDQAPTGDNTTTASLTSIYIPYFATFILQEWRELDRLLLSIDTPVQIFHLVVNEAVGASQQYIEGLVSHLKPHIKSGRFVITYAPNGDPFSFSESCNIVLQDAFFSNRDHIPHVFIVNADVWFGPGTIQNMLQFYQERKHILKRTIIDIGIGFSAFLLPREVVESVGTFDENFYPAYWEDIDYVIRMYREGITLFNLQNVPSVANQIVLYHNASTSIHKSSYEFQQRRTRVDRWVYAYLKWGVLENVLQYPPFEDHPSYFLHPFNVSSLPSRYWVKVNSYRECIRLGWGKSYYNPNSGKYHKRRCWFDWKVVFDDIRQNKHSVPDEETQQLMLRFQTDDVSSIVKGGKIWRWENFIAENLIVIIVVMVVVALSIGKFAWLPQLTHFAKRKV